VLYANVHFQNKSAYFAITVNYARKMFVELVPG
jgi:hypothetical protein